MNDTPKLATPAEIEQSKHDAMQWRIQELEGLLAAVTRESATLLAENARLVGERDAAVEALRCQDRDLAALLIGMCDGDYRANAKANIDMFILSVQKMKQATAAALKET